jgi:hypothetical protein
MGRQARRFAGIGVVLLVSVMAAGSAGAQGVGAIGGTLTDPSGAVLPGVTVTLDSAEGTIGGNQQTVTNERGTYQFTRLVPGRYTVKGELMGFRPAAEENLIVNADATTRADLKLEVGRLEEGIIVKGESPLVDTTSTLNQVVLSREILDTLPGRNDLWSLGRVTPGMVYANYDVGGTKATEQGRASVHGSDANENGYLVDGMDVSYTGPSLGITMLYFNPYMFEQLNYQTSSRAADQASAGMSYNMVTKSGANAYHGSTMFNGTRRGWVSDNVDPAIRSQLLSTVPARVLALNPNLKPGQDILALWDAAGTFSGPVIQDKLWFVTSGKWGVLNRYGLGNYNLDGTLALDDNWLRDWTAKASWQVNRSNQLSYLYYMNNKGQPHRGAGGAGFTDERARNRNDKYPNLTQLKLTSTLTPRMVMSVAGSLMTGIDPYLPVTGVQNGDIPRTDSILQTSDTALLTYYRNPMYRGVLLGSLNYELPGHSLMAGYHFNRAYFGTSDVFSTSHYPAGLRAVFRNGVPDSVNTSNSPVGYKQYMQEHALFVQDRWTPTQKLTLNIGGRFEHVRGWEPAACQPETIFIQGQCFSAIEDAPKFDTFSPRVSAVYDVFGHGRTAVKVAVNTYQNAIGTTYLDRINPIRRSSDTRPWRDANGDNIPQLDELGASTGFNLGTTNRYDAAVGRPHTNEYSAEFEQQLPGPLLLTVAYFRKNVRDNIGSRNLLVPTSSYLPIAVTELVSGRQVTVYNQAPATRGQFDVLWDNFSELDSDYNGADITFTKRMSRSWMAFGGVSIGKNTGDIYGGASDLNNPNFQFRRGIVGNDTTVAAKASGTYQFPSAISLTGSYQYATGLPQLTTVLVSANTIALTQVSQAITIEPRATVRYEPLNQVDISLRKRFTFRKLGFEPTLDIYNLFNSGVITTQVTQLGPTYGGARVILDGRLIKLGGTFNF